MTKPVLDYGRKEPGPTIREALGAIGAVIMLVVLPVIAGSLWSLRNAKTVLPPHMDLYDSDGRRILGAGCLVMLAVWVCLIVWFIRRVYRWRQRPGAD